MLNAYKSVGRGIRENRNNPVARVEKTVGLGNEILVILSIQRLGDRV